MSLLLHPPIEKREHLFVHFQVSSSISPAKDNSVCVRCCVIERAVRAVQNMIVLTHNAFLYASNKDFTQMPCLGFTEEPSTENCGQCFGIRILTYDV